MYQHTRCETFPDLGSSLWALPGYSPLLLTVFFLFIFKLMIVSVLSIYLFIYLFFKDFIYS